jgi:hypothetical protein
MILALAPGAVQQKRLSITENERLVRKILKVVQKCVRPDSHQFYIVKRFIYSFWGKF